MKSCYLAGPITGCTYDECTDWRQWFADQLPKIDCYDPMRAKMFLKSHMVIEGSYDENPLSTAQAIVSRDSFDCHRCDVLVVNLLGATIVSIGTMFEIAWAWRANTPIVLIMEPEGNIHQHPFIEQTCGFKVHSIEDGVRAVEAILV